MKLKNRLMHMRGKAVLVNGTKYDIDKKGFADVPNEDDCKKLLLGNSWVDPSSKVVKKAAPKKSGFLIVEDKKTGETKALDAPEKDDSLILPDKDISMKELRKMADDLGIKYRSNLAKSNLLERVVNAMKGE